LNLEIDTSQHDNEDSEMTSENTIRKTVQVVSVVALMIGATGCATQATGGSKLDHDEWRNEVVQNRNVIKVCTQFGPKMDCKLEDRDRVQEEFEYLRESLRYAQDY